MCWTGIVERCRVGDIVMCELYRHRARSSVQVRVVFRCEQPGTADNTGEARPSPGIVKHLRITSFALLDVGSPQWWYKYRSGVSLHPPDTPDSVSVIPPCYLISPTARADDDGRVNEDATGVLGTPWGEFDALQVGRCALLRTDGFAPSAGNLLSRRRLLRSPRTRWRASSARSGMARRRSRAVSSLHVSWWFARSLTRWRRDRCARLS